MLPPSRPTRLAYIAELESPMPRSRSCCHRILDERRVLVTNHEVFGYFADRYGFEVVGVIIPGGIDNRWGQRRSTRRPGRGDRRRRRPGHLRRHVILRKLATTLADEVGDIAVVTLYSGSLGEADGDGATYLGMVRTNAERISAALA